jgi:hypothetical protein
VEELLVTEVDENNENNENDENNEEGEDNTLSSFTMTQFASGDLCISSDENREIAIWDFKTHQKIKTIPIAFRSPHVMSMTVLRDGRLAICMDYQCSAEHDDDRKYAILIYNIETEEFEQELNDTYAFHVLQLCDGRLCVSFLSIMTIWK